MKLTAFFTLLLVIAPILLSASETRASIFIEPMYEARLGATPYTFCPIPEKLDNICMNIDSRVQVADKAWRQFHTDYIYVYQKKVLDAACIKIGTDDEGTVNRKVQAMWSASRANLNCDSVQFDVSGGNVLKFAVSTKFDQFIEDAIWWGVDLNWVDKIDNRTVLDYVTYQIEKNKGKNIESKLAHYYKILKEAGAKHRHELKTEK
jgi:hypothetical protein